MEIVHDNGAVVKPLVQTTEVNLSPGAAEFRRFVDYVHEHKELPTTSVNGNMGKFDKHVTDLIEQFNAHGYDGFVKGLEQLQKRYIHVNIALSSQEAAAEDANITIGKKGKPVLITLSMDDIDKLADVEWLIKKMLARKTTSLFFAESGVGKTFEALDMALHLVYNIPWIGRKVEACYVLYIYGEGQNGLKARKTAWQKYYGLRYNHGKPFPNHPNFKAIAHPVQLIGDRELIVNTIEDLPQIPDLIIIDTFSVCAIDVDENSNTAVAKALKTANDIRNAYGSHVMVIHHTGNENLEKWRGASAFKGNVDTMFYMMREANGPLLLKCMKQKDGAEPWAPIKLHLEPVHLGYDEDGDEITSCVIGESPQATTTETRSTLVQEHMVRILAVEGRLKTSQFKTAVMRDKELGVSRNEYYDNVEALEDAEKIDVVVNDVVIKGKASIKAAKNSGKTVWYRLPSAYEALPLPSA